MVGFSLRGGSAEAKFTVAVDSFPSSPLDSDPEKSESSSKTRRKTSFPEKPQVAIFENIELGKIEKFS